MCPDCKVCALFARFAERDGFWLRRYCKEEWKTCERYRLAAAKQRVPDTMLPNGKLLAF